MKTLEFLNQSLNMGDSAELALVRLKERYAIKYRIYEDFGLVVLNYCQIDSPKFHQITKECRSLVLALPYENYECPAFVESGCEAHYRNSFQVVSRAFDRFFNYGEKKLPCKVDKLKFYDKLDGSLITVFHFNGQWLYRTKSMIMPVEQINGLEITWRGLIEGALHWDEVDFNKLSKEHSYIFEVCSPYNRIVTRYDEPQAYLLSVRSMDGIHPVDWAVEKAATDNNWLRPKEYTFDSWDSCAQGAKDLRNLKEGYVGYLKGTPTVKVKNPAYVAAHHLRGEGILTPKRILDLVIMHETDEYLSIFPEDTESFQPYIQAEKWMWLHIECLWSENKHLIKNPKEFALQVKDTPVASLLFSKRNGKHQKDSFEGLTRPAKHRMISAYLMGNLMERYGISTNSEID